MDRGVEKGKHELGSIVEGSRSARDVQWMLLQERSEEVENSMDCIVHGVAKS